MFIKFYSLLRECLFTIDSANHKSKFMSQVNNSFNSGGMLLALNDNQFSSFIQFLKDKSLQTLPIRRAADIIGLQDDSNKWVLGDLEIDTNGKVVESDDRQYVWLKNIIRESLPLTIQMAEVIPKIQLPFQTTELKK